VVRAFYNTCRHRGAKIVAADCGKASLLRCQYHSWAYALDGQLVAVPEERDFIDFDKSKRGLLPIRCETWRGWIFINLDDRAGALRDYLGQFGDELDGLGMEKLRVVHRYNAVVNCNWKAAMDAFQEIYHVTTIHQRSLGAALDFRSAAFGLFAGGHSRLSVPYHPDARAMLGMAGADVPEIPDYPAFARRSSFAYSAFPNIAAPLRSTVIHFQMFWPLTVDTCEMEVIGVGPDWGEGERPVYWEGANAAFREILVEDLENLSSIQASLSTKAFTGVLANYQERRIYWLHECVDAKIGHNRVPERLAVKPLLEPHVEQPLEAAE
jgi:phenylpropionate dioxygenase-like ring-hydroxylating dioxygenase large terminal subunit